MCVCACVQIFYRNDSLVAHVCDGSGEDPTCAEQYKWLSVSDHLTYFGIGIGVNQCGDDKGGGDELRADGPRAEGLRGIQGSERLSSRGERLIELRRAEPLASTAAR